ncbi:MAG TPA: glycoside hydrolase family 57 protein [Candidatus Acidoferrales bacterium]|nr:glycoside hydrolase family 57 protein [Candidatus Acidoferrales bacterium]
MNRVHLILLWHMHQPQYCDPSSGRYVLPWTRLHALKDYWGMVRVLEEFPRVHATFNMVPSLAVQLEEYASGLFDEPWFDLAFGPTEGLSQQDKEELLGRGFQVNRENLLRRWPRYGELFDRAQARGEEWSAATWGPRDWRDLQVLSQLAWMDEEWLASDPVVASLSRKGSDFTEADKESLRAKQLELLGSVLPIYRRAAERGQIEISTTPFYHPILPLLCDTDIAARANPSTPLLQPAFRHPEDAGEQLQRARGHHQRVFGQPPVGLWPSEGSVSDQALALAAGMGFRWFATDEGVLGRTLGVGFGRDAAGVPDNAGRLYSPLRVRLGGGEMVGFFRDHYLSDLIGFVYGRLDAGAAAEDLHRRLRTLGERVALGRPLSVSLILDGENAWEYYPGNGREFLRQFYRRIEGDPDIRALTVSEAVAAAGEIPTVESIFPGSWINANFDIWIGHSEDVAAWRLLREAREFYGRAQQGRAKGLAGAPSEQQLATAYESVLAAEGSDWCWWYGPEHSSANDAEFDALYRKHLTEIYLQLGAEAPDELAEPIKRRPERAVVAPPTAYLKVQVDGRETSYFEWLGAGLYSADRRSAALHGRSYFLHELRYGFGEEFFYVRVDTFPEVLPKLRDCEFRVTVRAGEELRIVVRIEEGKLAGYLLESKNVCILGPDELVQAAFDKILEVAIAPRFLALAGRTSLSLGVALWHGGLPVDLLPAEGWLNVQLGTEAFAWPAA